MRSILICESGSSSDCPRAGEWSHKSFQIIMNSWLEVEGGVCVCSVLNQKEKLAKGVCHRDFILITEQTTKRGASKQTLKRFFKPSLKALMPWL